MQLKISLMLWLEKEWDIINVIVKSIARIQLIKIVMKNFVAPIKLIFSMLFGWELQLQFC